VTAVGGGRDGSDDIVVKGGRCEFGWRGFGILFLGHGGFWNRRPSATYEMKPRPLFFGLHDTYLEINKVANRDKNTFDHQTPPRNTSSIKGA
jgi:hypothetical protein